MNFFWICVKTYFYFDEKYYNIFGVDNEMKIVREHYLEKIRPYYDIDLSDMLHHL